MPAKNHRVNVVLGRPLYDALSRLARRDGASLSLKVGDLLREALEWHEDVALGRIAAARDRPFESGRAFTHDQVWRVAERSKRR